ncbi:MAG: serine protease, partial [Planctomycetes bacterium]|nr:serine protease [Planctomycetota bacterium]
MKRQSIKSWVVVLSTFLVVVFLCMAWQKFKLAKTPAAVETQLVHDPQFALDKVSPSVVSLWAIKQKGVDTHISVIGCGLIVNSQGLILTSATLTNDIESLHIIDHLDNRYQASVIIVDKKTKLTLLKADTTNATESAKFEVARLADVREIVAGDGVFVLGSRRTPSNSELTTKMGKITDPHQSLVVNKIKYRDLIQTDLPLTSENAGGPLVNLDGEVIGFALPFLKPPNTAAFSYAVGVDYAAAFLTRLPIPKWT